MTRGTDVAQRRIELASDPRRPTFHFVAPHRWMEGPDESWTEKVVTLRRP
jgi:hypothetical protein